MIQIALWGFRVVQIVVLIGLDFGTRDITMISINIRLRRNNNG